jgi:pimeloyl-ACP methyl ester carboxylesterase
MKTLPRSLVGTIWLIFFQTCAIASAPTPPSQPTSGPGSSEYAHTEFIEEIHGAGDAQYWIFFPNSPKPATAPVIIFTHGWGGMEPKYYAAWLQHLTRRGNIVIYPRYQANLRTPTKDFTKNALAAVQAALQHLQTPDSPVKPDLARIATVGHSVGGLLAANLAVELPRAGLPAPKAIMAAQPGKTWGKDRAQVPLLDLSTLPSETLLLTIVGEDDQMVRDVDAKRIFKESNQIPVSNKNYITLVSDNHGEPAITASHVAPTAPIIGDASTSEIKASKDLSLRQRIVARRLRKKMEASGAEFMSPQERQKQQRVDALDYYGTWKLLDALTDAAFYGRHREIALGGGAAQTFMGNWSDGVPVKPLLVTTQP